MILKLVFIVLGTFSFLAIEDPAEAAKIFCPPYYECAYLHEVVSGDAKCPDGYICQPVFGMPDCPAVYACFIKIPVPKDSDNSVTDTSITPSFSIFISSIEPFSIYPGYEVSIKGQNLSASSSIMIMKGSSLMTKLAQNSIKKESAGSYTIKFTLPTYFIPGPYSLYLENPDGEKSNTISFYVTSVVPATTPTGTPTTTPLSPNTPVTAVPPATNTTNPVQPSSNNNPVQNPSVVGAKFAIGNLVRTTDNLRVRNTPTIYGILLTTQVSGAQGIVIGGPKQADGYTWWNIDYQYGLDGWSVETYLTKSSSYVSNPTPVTSVTAPSSAPTTITPSVSNSDQCYTFSTDLSYRSSLQDEIMYLQTAFMAEGYFIAEAEKRPNPYFGDSTLSAAINYQKKYGITPQAGYVGPKTRAQLNMKYGCR